MTILQAIILGIIQGLTEFLPVSSSGHLTLLQHFFNLGSADQLILFDLACHIGTLGSIFVVFHKQILSIFTTHRHLILPIAIATAPLFLVAAGIKYVKELYADPRFLGLFFLTTALLLFLATRYGKEKPISTDKRKNWSDALLIGLFQAFAVLPGVSRSGATISAAKLLGWSWDRALTFSFLIAIPAILGATAHELLGVMKDGIAVASIPLSHYAVAIFTSFFVGWGALLLLINLANNHKFHYFGWYCLVLGIGTLLYFNL